MNGAVGAGCRQWLGLEAVRAAEPLPALASDVCRAIRARRATTDAVLVLKSMLAARLVTCVNPDPCWRRAHDHWLVLTLRGRSARPSRRGLRPGQS